jgi:hypothetical protein
MNGLVLDTKDSMRRTYNQVIQPVVPLRDTRTYQPIQNKELLDMLALAAKEFGLELQSPEDAEYGEARKRQHMFGVFEITGHDHFDNQVKLMLGVRNAFDGSMSVGICFGSKVFVCSNLCFSGYVDDEIGIVGHTSHYHKVRRGQSSLAPRLRTKFSSALKQVDAFKDFQNNFYNGLRDTRLSTNDGYEVIIDAARNDVLPQKDILRVANEWNEPSHQEFADRNAWSLHNAFTEQYKTYIDRNPVTANGRLVCLTEFFQHTFMN